MAFIPSRITNRPALSLLSGSKFHEVLPDQLNLLSITTTITMRCATCSAVSAGPNRCCSAKPKILGKFGRVSERHEGHVTGPVLNPCFQRR